MYKLRSSSPNSQLHEINMTISNMRRFSFNTVLSACLVSIMLSACSNKNSGDSAPQIPPAEVTYITATVAPVTEFSELPGRLNSIRIAQIRARVPGVVVEQVQGGMDVKQGQLLFRIDPEPLKASYNSAEASLQKAQAVQAQTQAKADRFKSLIEFNAVSKQDYIDATASAQTAVADVAASRAALQTAKLNLAYTNVTAPISGYMGRPLVTQGDLVGQGEATLLTTVQQLDPIYMDLTQSSNEVLRIRQAMESGRLKRAGKDEVKVTLVLDDGSHYPLTGKLLFSDISVDTTTSMVTLRAQFPNPNRLLLPGMYARALVEESADKQAILIPQRVVSRGDNGTASVMLVGKDDKIEIREVKLGEARKDQWLVAEGLRGGERIVIEGLQMAAPGAQVKAKPYTPANVVPNSNAIDAPTNGQSAPK